MSNSFTTVSNLPTFLIDFSEYLRTFFYQRLEMKATEKTANLLLSISLDINVVII